MSLLREGDVTTMTVTMKRADKHEAVARTKPSTGPDLEAIEGNDEVIKAIEAVVKARYSRRSGGPKKYSKHLMKTALVKMCVLGISVSYISEDLKIPTGTLYNWKKLLNKQLSRGRKQKNSRKRAAA